PAGVHGTAVSWSHTVSQVQDSMNMVVEALVDGAIESASARPPPEATYRLQFHAGFTFADAARVVSYLDALGVTDCYASPYLKARAGSTHGYDITDHGHLN